MNENVLVCWMNWKYKTILVTGETGFFCKKVVEIIMKEKNLSNRIVFSRNELKQHGKYVAGYYLYPGDRCLD